MKMIRLRLSSKRYFNIGFFVLSALCVSGLFWSAFASNSVLFDDQGTAYWRAFNSGTGSLRASVANETIIVQSGVSSVKAVITSGSYQNVAFYHGCSPTADWSAYNVISFWLHGSNSGQYITLLIFGPTTNDYSATLIRDNFVGWQNFAFDLNSSIFNEINVFKHGNPDLSKVAGIQFAFTANTTVYIDRMILDIIPSPTTTSPSPLPTSTSPSSPSSSNSSNLPTPTPTPTPTLSSSTPSLSPSSSFYPQNSSSAPTQTPLAIPSEVVVPSPLLFVTGSSSSQPNFLSTLQENWLLTIAIGIIILAVVVFVLKKKH